MNELFDALDEKTGKKTGEVISKDEATLRSRKVNSDQTRSDILCYSIKKEEL